MKAKWGKKQEAEAGGRSSPRDSKGEIQTRGALESAGRPSMPHYDYAYEKLIIGEGLSRETAFQRMNHPDICRQFGYVTLDWESFKKAMNRRRNK
jgi:hypothetical protein